MEKLLYRMCKYSIFGTEWFWVGTAIKIVLQ
jgi:hypothetical protein